MDCPLLQIKAKKGGWDGTSKGDAAKRASPGYSHGHSNTRLPSRLYSFTYSVFHVPSPKILESLEYDVLIQKRGNSPGLVAPLVGASSNAPKGCRFNSWTGHIPSCGVRACMGGK